MANIKQQKKRILTNEKARVRNQAVKSELKTYVRRVREAVSAGVEAYALAAHTGPRRVHLARRLPISL